MNRLTQSPLVHLFRRESENRYEFCQYFDKNPGHRRGGSIDVGVNHESSNKALYAFKNFDKGIVASFHGLGSLVNPRYQNGRVSGASVPGYAQTEEH